MSSVCIVVAFQAAPYGARKLRVNPDKVSVEENECEWGYYTSALLMLLLLLMLLALNPASAALPRTVMMSVT